MRLIKNLLNSVLVFILCLLCANNVEAKWIDEKDVVYAICSPECATKTEYDYTCYNHYRYNGLLLDFTIYPTISYDGTYTSIYSDFSSGALAYNAIDYDVTFLTQKVGDAKAYCMHANKQYDRTSPYCRYAANTSRYPIFEKIFKVGDQNEQNAQFAFWFLFRNGSLEWYTGGFKGMYSLNDFKSNRDLWRQYYSTVRGDHLNTAQGDVDSSYFFDSVKTCTTIANGSGTAYFAVSSVNECNIIAPMEVDGKIVKPKWNAEDNVCEAKLYESRAGIEYESSSQKIQMYEISGNSFIPVNSNFWQKVYPNYNKIIDNLNVISNEVGSALTARSEYSDFCNYVNGTGDFDKVPRYKEYNTNHPNAKYVFYQPKTVEGGAPSDLDSQIDKALETSADGVVTAIEKAPSNSGDYYIWQPQKSTAQWIISEHPSKYDISCSNFLGAVKHKYNYYKANLDTLVNNPDYRARIDAIYDMFGLAKKDSRYRYPTCGTNQGSCYKTKRLLVNGTLTRNPNYNRKIKGSSQFYYSYGFVFKTSWSEDCECTNFKKNPDKIAYYFGDDWTCDDIKHIEGLKTCDNKTKKITCETETCTTPPCGGNSYKCEDRVDSYSGLRPKSDYNKFLREITDDENAKWTPADESGNTGYISCAPPCEPFVVKPATCDAEGKAPSYFTLKDASNLDGTPDPACYQQGTAYALFKEGKQGSKDANLSKSKYCDVYCWESLTADFPSSPSAWGAVTAGEKFYWGVEPLNNVFSRLETRRICWAKPDYNTFNADWNANEAAISQAYADYQAQVLYNQKTDVKVSDDHCCKGGSGTETDLVASLSSSGSTTAAAYGYDSCSCGGSLVAGSYYECSCTRTKCTDGYGKTYTIDSADYTIPGTNIKGTSTSKTSSCVSSAPDASELHDGDAEASRRSTLENLVANRYTLKSSLEACQSTSVINENTMYDYSKAKMSFKPETVASLNLSSYGVKDPKLVGQLESSLVTVTQPTGLYKTFGCSGISGGIRKGSNAESDICDGTSYISVDDHSTNGFYWDYNGIYAFKYSDEFFFVSKKINSEVTNMVDGNSEKPSNYEQENNLYYILGYGLPVSFKKSTGYFEIGVEMSGFGNDGHFDKILQLSDSKERYGYNFKDGYSCPYFVHNPLYQHECNYSCNSKTLTCTKTADSPAECPGKYSLSLVYRVIDMASGDVKRIFPSIDGDGRNPAENWAAFINGRNNAFKNITTYSKIYDQTPMYTIDLTPTNIGVIRASNKTYRESGKDPYTSYKDPSNVFKIKCDDKGDDGKSCVSSYITELIKRNIISGGTMKIESEDQRLVKLHNYKTCYDVANPHC